MSIRLQAKLWRLAPAMPKTTRQRVLSFNHCYARPSQTSLYQFLAFDRGPRSCQLSFLALLSYSFPRVPFCQQGLPAHGRVAGAPRWFSLLRVGQAACFCKCMSCFPPPHAQHVSAWFRSSVSWLVPLQVCCRRLDFAHDWRAVREANNAPSSHVAEEAAGFQEEEDAEEGSLVVWVSVATCLIECISYLCWSRSRLAPRPKF